MTSELRAVIDTNVAISALLLPRSIPRKAFDFVVEHGRLLVSTATVAELDDVLRRPKFDRYVREEERLEFLAAMIRVAEVVDITTTVTACRDTKDNKFLEVAISGEASHLITGDADLLVLHPFQNTAIMTPQLFLESTLSE